MNAEKREIGVVAYPTKNETAPSGKQVFIIFNRFSHSGLDKTEELIQFCKKAGFDATLVHTKKPGDAKRIALEILANNENPLLIAVGGDGTHSQVTSALVETGKNNIPVIYYAAGSGQDIARLAGHNKRKIKEALLWKTVETEKLDALKMTIVSPDGTQQDFSGVGYISFGVSANIAREINKVRPKTIAGHIITAIRGATLDKIKVKIGTEEKEYSDIIIGNSSTLGRFIKLKTEPQDGKFDAYFLEGKRQSLHRRVIMSLMRPETGTRMSELSFIPLSPISPQIDGEQIGNIEPGSRIRIQVEKGAVPVLTA
jgi:diacylglycerol kinase family enzyme